MTISERDLRILGYIQDGKGNDEISKLTGISKHSIRHIVNRLRKEGYSVPRRSPLVVMKSRTGSQICTHNSQIAKMQKELAELQTCSPKGHLKALSMFPLFPDVKLRQR